jgi:hypothetical protein
MAKKMNDKKLWIDDIHNGMNIIRNIANDLEYQGSLFFQTGNELLAKRFQSMARGLIAAERSINNGIGEKIYEDSYNAQESTATLLETIFTGVIRKEKE